MGLLRGMSLCLSNETINVEVEGRRVSRGTAVKALVPGGRRHDLPNQAFVCARLAALYFGVCGKGISRSTLIKAFRTRVCGQARLPVKH